MIKLFPCVEKVWLHLNKQNMCSIMTVFNFKWCQRGKQEGCPWYIWRWGNEQMYLNLLLCTVFLLSEPDAVWLSAALSWHLNAIQQRKGDVCLSLLVCFSNTVRAKMCVCVCVCLPAVIWSSECAFLSTAPLSSSGSSRRMQGNTPAVRATVSASHPLHRPTWLFSVSITVATKWMGEGRGDGTASCMRRRREQQQQQYGGCCVLWQRCSTTVMQSNLLSFQGQTWQRVTRLVLTEPLWPFS